MRERREERVCEASSQKKEGGFEGARAAAGRGHAGRRHCRPVRRELSPQFWAPATAEMTAFILLLVAEVLAARLQDYFLLLRASIIIMRRWRSRTRHPKRKVAKDGRPFAQHLVDLQSNAKRSAIPKLANLICVMKPFGKRRTGEQSASDRIHRVVASAVSHR